MATQYDPIAKDESLNTTETPSRNVADVLAEELQNIASAIGGGGSGGHTIEGADGTALSQEPTLQFADADASDDAVNEKTVVNVVRKRTQAEYDDMSAADKAKGVIEITDADAKPLFDTQVRRSNGDGTVADALDSAAAIHTIGLGNNQNTLLINLGSYQTNIMITAATGSGALLYLFSNGYLKSISTISGISVTLDSQTYKDITIVNNSGNNTYVSVYARGDEDITITKQ